MPTGNTGISSWPVAAVNKNMAATGSTLPMAAMTDYTHRHYTSMKEVCQLGGTNIRKYPSPCLSCTRVAAPRACENKNCKLWRQWFLDRWDLIHQYPRHQMEQAELKPAGVSVGGHRYSPPHRVREYLDNDPCDGCLCPKDLCTSPCPVKRAWEETKGDEFV